MGVFEGVAAGLILAVVDGVLILLGLALGGAAVRTWNRTRRRDLGGAS
jgi:hypothetical protein